jgi:hypothetical protein
MACNGTDEPLDVDRYLMLDVYGMYWFWPSWDTVLDSDRNVIPPCDCVGETILEFVWPSNSGSGEARFWTVMLETGTFNVAGDYGMCEFSWES